MQPQPDKVKTLRDLLAYQRQDPGNDRLRAAVFDAALAADDFAEARFQVVHGRLTVPESAAWRNREALLLLATGDFAAAVERLSALVEETGDQPDLLYNLAFARFSLGETAAAELLVAPLRAGRSETGDLAWILWLRCMHWLARVDEALQAFVQAAAARAMPADAWGAASVIALDASRMKEADSWSTRALGVKPLQIEALVTRGTLALAMQDAAAAQRFFAQSLELGPQDRRSWSGMAFAQMLLADFPAARAAFARAVATMPGHIGTWIGAGWCAFFGDAPLEACELFEKSLSLDRNFAESHGSLAVALARLDRRDAAKREIDLALGLDRYCLSARYAEAVLGGDVDDPEAFRKFVRRVLEQRAAGTGGSAGLVDRLMQQPRRPPTAKPG
jgi:tetratricopeptide (TPR) repeat protein